MVSPTSWTYIHIFCPSAVVSYGHFTGIFSSFVSKAKYFYLFCVCKSTSSFQSFNVLVQAYLTDLRKELKILKSSNHRKLTLPSELMSAFSKAFSRFSAPDFFFFLAAATAPTLPGIFCKGVFWKAPYIKNRKKEMTLSLGERGIIRSTFSAQIYQVPKTVGKVDLTFITIRIFLKEIQFSWLF